MVRRAEDKIKITGNKVNVLTYKQIKQIVEYPIISENEKLLLFIPYQVGKTPYKVYYKIIKNDNEITKDLTKFDMDIFSYWREYIRVGL